MPKRPLSLSVLHIMLALAGGAKHGYAIKQDVEARTDGGIRLGPGTLYEAIQRLEEGGLIAEASGEGRARERPGGAAPLLQADRSRLEYPADRNPAARPRRRPGPRARAAAQGPRVRLFRLLSLAYPPRFRRRYRQDLESAFEQTSASRVMPVPAGASRFWAFILRDLAAASARLWLRQISSRSHPSLPTQPSRNEMDTIIQDISYALRQFVRRPGFAAVGILSLGLAIGANSLIYGLVQGFVLHPFPYPDPDRLVAVGVGFPRISNDRRYVETLSPAEYADIKSLRSFGPAAAFDLGNRNISGGDVPERVFTALLLDDLFPVIGMAPQLGRGFTREELAPGGPPAAIISNRLWHTRFGGDPGIVGRSVRISSQSTTVVGVMPPGLRPDRHRPLDAVGRGCRRRAAQPRGSSRSWPGFDPVRRSPPPTPSSPTLAGQTDQGHRGQFKEYEGWSLTAAPWAAALLEDMRPAAFLMLGAVGLVLLIACANLTHLFLARSTTRQRELAVRLALGAGRWRIARHVLTETVLLALAGGVAGIVLAAAGMRGATSLLPAQLQMLDLHAAIDTRVLLWSLGLAAGHRRAGRPGPGLPGDAHRSARVAQDRRPRRSGSRRRTSSQRAGGCRSGAVGGAAARRRAADADLHQHPARRSRLRAARRADDAADAAARSLCRGSGQRVLRRAAGAAGGAAAGSCGVRLVAVSADGRVRHPVQGRAIGRRKRRRHSERDDHRGDAAVFRGAAGADAERPELQRDRFAQRAAGRDREPGLRRSLSRGGEPIGRRIALGSPDRPRPWTTIVGVAADHRNAGATRSVRPEVYTPVRQQTDWNQLFLHGPHRRQRHGPAPVGARCHQVARPGTAGLSGAHARRRPSPSRRSSRAWRRCSSRSSRPWPWCWPRSASSA